MASPSGVMRTVAASTETSSRSVTVSWISLTATSISGAKRWVPLPPRVMVSSRISSYPRPKPRVLVVMPSVRAFAATFLSRSGSVMPPLACPSETISTVAPVWPVLASERLVSRSASR